MRRVPKLVPRTQIGCLQKSVSGVESSRDSILMPYMSSVRRRQSRGHDEARVAPEGCSDLFTTSWNMVKSRPSTTARKDAMSDFELNLGMQNSQLENGTATDCCQV